MIKRMQGELDLQQFYPEELRITSIEEDADVLNIYLKSKTRACICPFCGEMMTFRRGTRHRTVQDLPILGKQVLLKINSFDYRCDNEACTARCVGESFDGFLRSSSRMTERCSDFVTSLALETSCEGAARICKAAGIQVSGDTLIRMVLKRYAAMPEPVCGSTIGVDDFAYKKRNSYCTIVVDEQTHKPAAVLDGRDGTALAQWLEKNRHVTTVTRDRASAYAKVIREQLPDAMQIADRFHLHQNLMDVIKKTLNTAIPASVPVENADETGDGKKRVPQSRKN